VELKVKFPNAGYAVNRANLQRGNVCQHLPEYQDDDDCLLCDLERHGIEDNTIKRMLTADSGL
jgi:hypothetical protein